jgi:hypothetical protein
LVPFSQLPAVKKGIKNGAARKIFGPSYFVRALEVPDLKYEMLNKLVGIIVIIQLGGIP